MLRGWGDSPSVLVNWMNSERRELNNMGFYVAESCDGQTDFDSFAFLPQHLAVLDLLVAEGIAQECQEGNSLEPWQRYRKARNPRLTGIHWCVTGFCNLNCRHCYMQAPAGRYGELPFDAMAGLVEQFERANVLEVSLTGGEPFLRRDLLDLIQLLADKRIRLAQIYSNGLLITDQHLEGIRRIGFRPAFQISFDGVGAHDQMRGTRGTESRVVDTIRRLRGAGLPVVVSTSVDKLSIGSLADTYELMKGLDVQTWRIGTPQETGNWRGTTTATPVDEQAAACVPLAQRWLQDGRPFSLQLGGFYRGLRPRTLESISGIHKAKEVPPNGRVKPRSRRRDTESKQPAAVPEAPEYRPESYDCGACREQPNLLPDGTLLPCPGYVDCILQDRMPNLLREDLSKVWSRSFLREIADIRKRDLLAHNPECAACEDFKECGMGCRALALTTNGDLLAKDPLACELSKKGYKKRFREMAAEVS